MTKSPLVLIMCGIWSTEMMLLWKVGDCFWQSLSRWKKYFFDDIQKICAIGYAYSMRLQNDELGLERSIKQHFRTCTPDYREKMKMIKIEENNKKLYERQRTVW